MQVSVPLLPPNALHSASCLLADNDTVLERPPGEADIIGTAPDRGNELGCIGIAEDAAGAGSRDDTSTVGGNTISKVSKPGADLDAATVGGDVGLNGSVSLVIG